MLHRSLLLGLTMVCLSVGLPACKSAEAPAPPSPPPVSVAEVVARSISDYDEFTGRFEAIERVELRPRVNGYIQRVAFTQGKEVKAGDLLFEIDPRPYQTILDGARAELARNDSALALAQSDLARAEKLLAARAISKEEYDQRTSGLKQAEAARQVSQAAVRAAALDLEFTQVRAPIAGLAGRAEITVGNLVAAGQTLLTTLVSIDPIYVEFEVDELTALKYGDLARRGERQNSRDAANPVFIGLGNEEGHPHRGAMVFVNNVIDPQTGTIRGRAQLTNPQRVFTPGLFARVRLLGSGEYQAVLIRDSAIGTDQNVKYALVVDAAGATQYRPLKLGPVVDGLRVVREGLKPGEAIVVSGLQRVRPGAPVTPQRVPMVEPAAGAVPKT